MDTGFPAYAGICAAAVDALKELRFEGIIMASMLLAIALLARCVTGTTIDLSHNTGAAEEADEVGTPTALPCFGSSSGDTPSSPCPEPRSRNLRGRR